MPSATPFHRRVLDWFDQHGRKDLPWQQQITPYRVWVSEIMLQQTRVQTVIPYFERFVQAFPDVQALAAAPEDEVLHLWTGLGYYARGRNLHRAAKQVCAATGGAFPDSVEGLCRLPGVGRSTAGAIASIALGRRAAILDGNVKRVLARFHALPGWPGESAVGLRLWQIAEEYTPGRRCADYNQAMMDLGATLCTRTSPACERCPLRQECAARSQGRQQEYPGRKPRRAVPVKTTTFLMAHTGDGDIWLERRPARGIWGGLWCFPEVAGEEQCAQWCLDRWGRAPQTVEPWPQFRHTFTHCHLEIRPVRVEFGHTPGAVMDAPRQLWYNKSQPPAIGLAAPVASLLERL